MPDIYTLQKKHKRFLFVSQELKNCSSIEELNILLSSQNYQNINCCLNSSDGQNLLFLCNPKKTALLISAGINVDHKDLEGRSALFFSGGTKSKLLIAAGADINIQDNNGDNAISFYKGTVNLKKIKLLSDLGLDPNHKNNAGYNLMDRVMNNKSYVFMDYDVMIELPKYGVFLGISGRIDRIPEKVLAKMKLSLVEYEKEKLVIASYEKNILDNNIKSTVKMKDTPRL